MTRKTRNSLLILLALFLATYGGLALLFQQKTEEYALHEAEKQMLDLLLNHRAIHEYINKVQRPELYRLKEEGKLYQEYFSPKVLSFTFIARGIKEFLNEERRKNNLPEIYFKLASENPRNPINTADDYERQLLRRMNADELTEYREVRRQNDGRYLYVAIPVQPSNRECLTCHGDPKNAPRELVAQYGDQAGFHERIGETRALISMRIPLEQHMADARRIYNTLSLAALGALTIIFLLIGYFFRHHDAQQQIILEKNRALELLSATDYLTGAHNRLGLQNLLAQQLREAVRYHHPLSLLMIDLDYFKAINDRHGHLLGDTVLKEFSRFIADHIRASDILGRWGGEEFVVVLPQQGAEAAQKLAEKLRQMVADTPLPSGITLTASFGVSTLTEDDRADDLIERADRALYASKKAGRNRVTYLATSALA